MSHSPSKEDSNLLISRKVRGCKAQFYVHRAYLALMYPQCPCSVAALVIQGSACVYSKKVEYLHSLVYQALEFVAERKVKALRSRGQGPTQAQEDDEFDEEERFLTLDDTLEGRND
jgi:hypothetical protein